MGDKVQRALQWERSGGTVSQRPDPGFQADKLPDPDISAEDLIAYRKKTYAQRNAAETARKLIGVRVKIDGPIGITHFGDVHIDDDGCWIEKLEMDMNSVRDTEGMFGANLGDLQNNWVGRLARLWANQGTSASQSWKLVEWMINYIDWLYIIGGNHDCADYATQALTKRGWKSYNEIEDTDLVFSLNRDTGKGEWTPILRRIERHHSGDMVSVEARGISMLVTPNHRVLGSRRLTGSTYSDMEFYRADSLPNRIRLPVSAPSQDKDYPISDDKIRLAAWILTDGHIQTAGSPRITIYQSKYVSEIERVLVSCGVHSYHSIRHRNITHVAGKKLVKPPLPQHEFSIGAEATREILKFVPRKGELPSWAWELSGRQFNILLDTLIQGDGSWASNGQGTSCVLNKDRAFLESVQSVAIQHGWRATITVAREKDYRLNLCNKTTIDVVKEDSVSTVSYDGTVWCLTVPHGNFMVRRDGCAYFTGNCWSGNGDPLKWMTRGSKGVFENHGARLGLTFPNGKVVRVNARHDFAGHSQWNPAHGAVKASMMGWRDHILTCGHKHTSYISGPMKDPSSGLLSWAIRCAGYKIHDDYAAASGFPDQNAFPACVTIIDPQYADNDTRLVTVIPDVQEAAEYLTWKRAKWSSSKRTRK
jgi:hypothetical protein